MLWLGASVARVSPRKKMATTTTISSSLLAVAVAAVVEKAQPEVVVEGLVQLPKSPRNPT